MVEWALGLGFDGAGLGSTALDGTLNAVWQHFSSDYLLPASSLCTSSCGTPSLHPSTAPATAKAVRHRQADALPPALLKTVIIRSNMKRLALRENKLLACQIHSEDGLCPLEAGRMQAIWHLALYGFHL
jgi:hypothetical protein